MSRAMGAVLVAALVAISFAGIVYGQQANSNSSGSQTDIPHLEFVFDEFVTLGAGIHPGETPFGDRNIVLGFSMDLWNLSETSSCFAGSVNSHTKWLRWCRLRPKSS